MSKRTLIKGALVLTIANFTTRFIGFFYRVYMSNTLGAEGMGLYQLIMPVYALCWSITSSGFTTTLSKLTAEEKARGGRGNMRRMLFQSMFMSVSLSLVVSLLLYIFAETISINIISEPRTYLSIKLLSVCIPFMTAGSCMRGYFFGIQNTSVPAASQVIEQIVRVAAVFLTAGLLVPYGLEFACLSAVIGIAAGEILSFLFVFLSYQAQKNGRTEKPTISRRKSASAILGMAVPLSANRIIGSLLTTTENILIPQRLKLFSGGGESAMSIYGSLTGMAMPLIQFPSALLVAVSVSLVPEISEAAAVNNRRRIRVAAGKSVFYTMLVAVGVASVFAVFPSDICSIVYNRPELGSLLFKLSLICPLMYLQITLSGILNGLGAHVFLFRNSMMSSVINIFFIYFLMPAYGIDAFIFGWLASLIVTASLSLYKTLRLTGNRMDFKNWIFYPLLCALASGLFVRLIYLYIEKNRLMLVLLVCLMFILYTVFLFATGCVKKEDIPFRKF